MSINSVSSSYSSMSVLSDDASSDVVSTQGDSVFSYGLDVLFSFMDTMSGQANSQFASMKASSEHARDIQELSGQLDGLSAQMANMSATDTMALPSSVVTFCSQNNISYSDPSNKGQITSLKNTLDNLANRATDFVSTAQLQLQKQMQTYNVCVSLVNSMQSMLSEMNKTIAQGIR